jgi:hypothetical protein
VSRAQTIALVALFALALAGCGNGKFNARGRVVKGGAPFTVPKDEYVRVTFYPQPPDSEAAHNTYVAAYKREDGTFTVVGADGTGLPPGKYRVAVEHEKKRKDLLKGKFDAEKSPFVLDVQPGGGEIILDLDKAP